MRSTLVRTGIPIVLLSLLVAPAARSATSVSRDALFAMLRSADSVQVARMFTVPPDSLHRPRGLKLDALGTTRTVSAGPFTRVSSEWASRFVDELAARSRWVPGASCKIAWWTDRTNEQLLAHVGFLHAGLVTIVELHFREGCASVQQISLRFADGSPAGRAPRPDPFQPGSFEIDANSDALFALIVESLPRDSALAAMPALPKWPKNQQEAGRQMARPTEPAPGATGGRVDMPRVGEYVYVEELPEALKKVAPEYPIEARKANVDGTVMLQALVGKDGRVKDTSIIRSIPLLDRAAIAAVEQWEFKPAMAKGAPVAVWVVIPVKFTLR